jgi:hypothetical protein
MSVVSGEMIRGSIDPRTVVQTGANLGMAAGGQASTQGSEDDKGLVETSRSIRSGLA